MEHLDWINDQLTIMAEAFGEKLTEERQEIYCAGLAELPQNRLDVAFRRARYELKWFPKLAELRELAGIVSDPSNDGRPGPEEAWARMPKGERLEEDSIVWCEEERIAYGACRGLLLNRDQIAARMAFKECYERELASARSQGTPVQWTISAGYDVGHRLGVLAKAVEEKKLSLEGALNFVPDKQRGEFAQMLPVAQTKGLLSGKAESLPAIPGLLGLLAKLRMEDILPEELKPASQPQGVEKLPLSGEDTLKRREELRAQAEFVKRSRNGPKS
ncbi:MAG TPA: hypothetical protein VK722_00815 [Candidatus Aquilonibacter sp.]|nr:hypothetical protein [Candidatus Aquilonibacter sp.]